MDDGRVFYECDPDKNHECRKIACGLIHPQWSNGCVMTSKPECARTDSEGNPIVSKDWEEWKQRKEQMTSGR